MAQNFLHLCSNQNRFECLVKSFWILYESKMIAFVSLKIYNVYILRINFDALYNLNGIWHIPKMIAAYVIFYLFIRNCPGYHSTHILWKYDRVSRDLKAMKIRNFEIRDKRKTLISAYKTTLYISKYPATFLSLLTQ